MHRLHRLRKKRCTRKMQRGGKMHRLRSRCAMPVSSLTVVGPALMQNVINMKRCSGPEASAGFARYPGHSSETSFNAQLLAPASRGSNNRMRPAPAAGRSTKSRETDARKLATSNGQLATGDFLAKPIDPARPLGRFLIRQRLAGKRWQPSAGGRSG